MEQTTYYYLTQDDINDLTPKIYKILQRNKLSEDENRDKLVASVLILGDYYSAECDLFRLFNQESSERMDRFISGINELFKRAGNEIHIRFKEKGQPQERKSSIKSPYVKEWELAFKDKAIVDWVIKILRVSLIEGRVPLNIGSQLFKLDLIKDPKIGGYRFDLRDTVSGSYEYARPDVIIADTVAKISIGLLNVLNSFTPLKFENHKWVASQLAFVIEVLIALGFYKSLDKKFVIGSSKPTVDDKKWLLHLLNRKQKQGLIVRKSETETPDS